jgi:hypothetical protein
LGVFPAPCLFALIVVNASTPSKHKWRIIDTLPGLTDIIGKTSDIMLQSYNFETMFLLRKSLKELEQRSSEKGAQHPPIQTYLMDVGFDALTEKAEQMEFAEIPTFVFARRYG